MTVVAFGGGTGLPVLLRGLRHRATGPVTAVVTVADDGGSSGRVGEQLQIAAPGDVRNCLVALADDALVAEVFSHRFAHGKELRGHAVGNLIIAALAEMAGDFAAGIDLAGRMLDTWGHVYPAASERVALIFEHLDGSITRGESTIGTSLSPVRRVAIAPARTPAPPPVIDALAEAELIVLSSGSLFTSTIPSVLGAGVAEALAAVRVPVVYVANVMTQLGETTGFKLSDHVRAIVEHAGPVISDVLVDDRELPAATVARYAAEGGAPVAFDRDAVQRLGVRVHAARLLPELDDAEVRHDPGRLGAALTALAERL